MNEKLTLVEKIMMMFGYGFIHNKRTNEVHRLSSKHKNCGLHLMSRCNKSYVSESKVERLLLDDDADGCFWCWKENDKG